VRREEEENTRRKEGMEKKGTTMRLAEVADG
jgi:hypothetical protein